MEPDLSSVYLPLRCGRGKLYLFMNIKTSSSGFVGIPTGRSFTSLRPSVRPYAWKTSIVKRILHAIINTSHHILARKKFLPSKFDKGKLLYGTCCLREKSQRKWERIKDFFLKYYTSCKMNELFHFQCEMKGAQCKSNWSVSSKWWVGETRGKRQSLLPRHVIM